MRNIKLTIAFDGTAYSGWQRQKDQQTIQGVLEEKISLMSCSSIALHGSGRTDAGVHALGMVANFHTDSTINEQGYLKGLNSLLPKDIRVLNVSEVDRDFHSRFNAVGKTYRYQVSTSIILSPTRRLYWAHYQQQLNIKAMRSCLSMIIGEHDFKSFEATGSRDLSKNQGCGSVRKITQAELVDENVDGSRFSFYISGNGFLRHMVRNIVGTVIEVGTGKINPDQFLNILRAKDRTLAGVTAPACGLFLVEVFY